MKRQTSAMEQIVYLHFFQSCITHSLLKPDVHGEMRIPLSHHPQVAKHLQSPIHRQDGFYIHVPLLIPLHLKATMYAGV
jgi:hypothetical protein